MAWLLSNFAESFLLSFVTNLRWFVVQKNEGWSNLDQKYLVHWFILTTFGSILCISPRLIIISNANAAKERNLVTLQNQNQNAPFSISIPTPPLPFGFVFVVIGQ